MNSIIVFDRECGFCNKMIMLIAKSDINNHFRFTSSGNSFGKNLLEKFQIRGLDQSTLILIEEGNIYTKSMAIRKILLKISKYKIIGFLLFFIPKKISDMIYDFISKHRKGLIRNNVCKVANFEITKKFIM